MKKAKRPQKRIAPSLLATPTPTTNSPRRKWE
jgi:hypothetical protein